jgi:hypothetical protein
MPPAKLRRCSDSPEALEVAGESVLRIVDKRSYLRFLWVFALSAIFICVAVVLAVFFRMHPISIEKETEWAIGIYEGDSPLYLHPVQGLNNPVLKGSDVADVKAEYVADPFMVRSGDTWCMFFEVMNSLNHQGDIGCATSHDGLNWQYQSIVLDEPFHLSYPYVFHWESQFYMIPESAKAHAIRLYKAENFPHSWTLVSDLIKGSFVDNCIFYVNETWWIFACSEPSTHEDLHLFFADKLTGPWTEHPLSPIIRGNSKKAQSAGRVLVGDGKIIRFAQDSVKTYGKKVNAFLITEIGRTTYSESDYENNPILRNQGRGWNRHGMHHVDAHEISPGKWLAAVDGYRKHLALRIEY